jgi:hypothetical protein
MARTKGPSTWILCILLNGNRLGVHTMAAHARRQSGVLYSAIAGLDPPRDLPLAFTNCTRGAFLPISSWAAGTKAVREQAPCAVIVPLSRQLLQVAGYQGFVTECLARASEHEEFRFYVYLVDLDFPAFVELTRSNSLLGELADTVNMPSATGSTALVAIDTSLAQFFRHLDDIEDAPRCRMRLLRCFAVVSALSVPLAVGAVGAFALSAALCLTATPAPGGIRGSLVEAGNSYFLLTAVLLIVAQRRFRWLLIPAASVAAGLHHAFGTSAIPLLGGLGLALGTDYCRRSWIRLSPVHLCSRIGPTPQKPPVLRKMIHILHHGHVFPAHRAVFLSYARRTWCDGVVRELRCHLRQLKTECFLDIADIELGASWRRALEDGIRRATVMVFFDQDEPQEPPRLWHRVELITAAALRARTGLPRIVVVTPETAGTATIEMYRVKLGSLAGLADFHIVPLSPQRTAAFARTIAETPVDPSGGAGHPLFDLLAVWPAVFSCAAVLAGISWLGMVLFLTRLSLALSLAGVLLPVLGFELRIPAGILSVLLCLAAGFGFRAWLHSLYEAPLPLIRSQHPAFLVIATMNITIGVIVLATADPEWWIMSAACFLLAFVGLDHRCARCQTGSQE